MEADGRLTLYVIGYPKSGNTWLSRLLGDVLNCPVGSTIVTDAGCIGYEGQDRPGPYYVRYGHCTIVDGQNEQLVNKDDEFFWQMLTDEKIVCIYRDPRDILVSAAHHWGLSFPVALEHMKHGTFPLSWGGGYEPFVRSWLNAPFVQAVTTYEAMQQDAAKELAHILNAWQIPFSEGRLNGAVRRQSFTVRKKWTKKHGDGLPYGKDFQLGFLRRGEVGSWKDELPIELWGQVEEQWGELMADWGLDLDWGAA